VKYTLLTILALGTSMIASAQGPFSNLTSIDSHALNAVQLTFSVTYGPGTKLGTFQCPLQKSNSVGYCLATVNFTVPSGKRLVIENISMAMSYNPNGSGAILSPLMSLGVTVGNTTAFSSLPFDTTLSVAGSTYYVMNKSVRLYVDSGPGFPEITFGNLVGGGLGPDLGPATGTFGVTISGYYVDLN